MKIYRIVDVAAYLQKHEYTVRRAARKLGFSGKGRGTEKTFTAEEVDSLNDYFWKNYTRRGNTYFRTQKGK